METVLWLGCTASLFEKALYDYQTRFLMRLQKSDHIAENNALLEEADHLLGKECVHDGTHWPFWRVQFRINYVTSQFLQSEDPHHSFMYDMLMYIIDKYEPSFPDKDALAIWLLFRHIHITRKESIIIFALRRTYDEKTDTFRIYYQDNSHCVHDEIDRELAQKKCMELEKCLGIPFHWWITEHKIYIPPHTQ